VNPEIETLLAPRNIESAIANPPVEHSDVSTFRSSFLVPVI
jgi:hypothetical protein